MKAAEEESFILQIEKILRSAATKDKTKQGEHTPLETKLGKAEPQLTTEAGAATPRVSPPTLLAKVATKSSPLAKSLSAAATSSGDESGTRSEGTVTRHPGPVVNEVTGEVLPLVPAEPTAILLTSSSRGDLEREGERGERTGKGPIVTEVTHQPLTRDVATGMSPAASSGIVLGSQSTSVEEVGGDKPPLSTQNSNEVSLCSQQ